MLEGRARGSDNLDVTAGVVEDSLGNLCVPSHVLLCSLLCAAPRALACHRAAVEMLLEECRCLCLAPYP